MYIVQWTYYAYIQRRWKGQRIHYLQDCSLSSHDWFWLASLDHIHIMWMRGIRTFHHVHCTVHYSTTKPLNFYWEVRSRVWFLSGSTSSSSDLLNSRSPNKHLHLGYSLQLMSCRIMGSDPGGRGMLNALRIGPTILCETSPAWMSIFHAKTNI